MRLWSRNNNSRKLFKTQLAKETAQIYNKISILWVNNFPSFSLSLTLSLPGLKILMKIEKGELARSRLRVDWIVLTRNLIWIMPT